MGAIKRAIVAGAIVGALAGSQTMNLLDTYQKALDSARYATKTEVATYENAFRKDPTLKDNEVMSKGYNNALKEYEQISNRSERYKKASDTKKTGMMTTDFKRYQLTAKSFKPAIPLSGEGLKKTGQGAVGGAGLGLGTLALWGIRKRRKGKRK